MIMISGEAGRLLALSKANYDATKADPDASLCEVMRAKGQFEKASAALADALIAEGHHLIEG